MSTLREANVSIADETTQADTLREAMVGELHELRAIHSDRVVEVFRTVPRHLFAPGDPLEKVYADHRPILTDLPQPHRPQDATP